MKRRQLLMLAGGSTVSAVVVGATAPPAQAIFPLLLRFLIGQGVRRAIRDRRKGKKAKKSSRRLRAGYRGSMVKSRRSGLRKVKAR
jgi:hypothetical protein